METERQLFMMKKGALLEKFIMKKEIPLNLQTEKQQLRAFLISERKAIAPERREEASLLAKNSLSERLSKYSRILSFASLPDEINIWPLNEQLCKEGRLFLPKVHENTLSIFPVKTFEELRFQSFGILEPISKNTSAIPIDSIDCILVPGLGSDENHHRIGYGKGFYDRLLSQARQIPAIGIFFKEQKIPKCPLENHDMILDEVYFF